MRSQHPASESSVLPAGIDRGQKPAPLIVERDCVQLAGGACMRKLEQASAVASLSPCIAAIRCIIGFPPKAEGGSCIDSQICTRLLAASDDVRG